MRIIMPKLGLTMTEGTLTRWRKMAGDPVKQGEILFEFESEKSALEFESPVAGVLAEILVTVGQTVPCGTPVATLEPLATTLDKLGSSEMQASRQPATPRAKARARELNLNLSQLPGSGPAGRIQLADVEQFWNGQLEAGSVSLPPALPKMTPVARRMAAEQQLDPSQIAGSTATGRITKDDLARALPPLDGDLIPLSPLRQTIAQRLSQSAFTAPHVTLFTEADATPLVEARAQLNAELSPAQKISYNTLLAAICARALREQPQVNALFDQSAQGVRLQKEINIALAVDTERGLTTPVLRRVDTLSLVSIQQGYAALIEQALAGELRPDDLAGGTFTITNLGAFEVDGFTPIINPPQMAILGAGRIAAKPVARENEVVIRQMMTLSLSFDHRALDGAPAARFLQRVKQLIERPFALML
ncbi:MAG: 2-oxo acid dehydrogenase subunit E2 [Anaerolineae bacterium]|nr:2-oxo acid dehydrogenase subunit E2 [Anaerolineales bacterium]MCQ3977247.1 2-oxo acid dehydrogenase subunit E2 [Anaerolineae bacterium]